MIMMNNITRSPTVMEVKIQAVIGELQVANDVVMEHIDENVSSSGLVSSSPKN